MNAEYVYVMRCPDDEPGLIKVGASRDPQKRAASLALQMKIPLTVCAAVRCDGLGMRSVEARAHEELKREGRHFRLEWFAATPSEALWAIHRSVRYHEDLKSRVWLDRRVTDKWSLPLLCDLPRVPLSPRYDCFM